MKVVLVVKNVPMIWCQKLVRYCIAIPCSSVNNFLQILCYFCSFSSGRCSGVNYAIKTQKFHFIQMPNLLTIHLSETHVYCLLHNDYSSEQLLGSISWTVTENLTNVPEGIFQCPFQHTFIKLHKFNIW